MKGPTRYMRERMLLKNKPRKVLNLEERVEAIKLYERSPVYQRVASKFRCSWEQIKNIVSKRVAILTYYANCRMISESDNEDLTRQKKINFLGQVMYECIKRACYHKSAPITDDFIKKQALEFREIIEIEKFYPNTKWVNDFKNGYNVNFDNLEDIVIVEPPKKSLNCKDIVSHCRAEVKRVLKSVENQQQQQQDDMSKSIYKEDDGDFEQPDADDSENDYDFRNGANNAFDDMDYEQLDDATVVENERGQVIYFGDGDYEINEDEVGPTINYDDYNYNEEEIDLKPSAEELLEEKRKIGALQHDDPTTTAASRSTTPTQAPTPTPSRVSTPPAKRRRTVREQSENKNPTSVENATASTTHDVGTYAEALNLLRPLEDFALQEEDFTAMNLLSRLTQVYQKALNRQRPN